MLPPVATAKKNRRIAKTMNHGTNASPTPLTSWRRTAKTSGGRRPYLKIKEDYNPANIVLPKTHLSDKMPKTMLPTRIPNMNNVWTQLAKYFWEQIKFHSVMIVLVKTLVSYLISSHSALHASVKLFGDTQVNDGLGARNTVDSWCQPTGNFTRKMNMQTVTCHGPKFPMAPMIGSFTLAS